jgi:CheY-like chemotaxis protein
LVHPEYLFKPTVSKKAKLNEESKKKTRTILVADDDIVFREFIKTHLERSGYVVIEAIDGIDAIKKFVDHKDRIELLIIDVIMPKMHGREVYESIKKMRPGIRTIFVSGYEADFINKKIESEEEIHLILKPDLPKMLLQKVQEILS